MIASRHAQLREQDPTLGPLPGEALLGHVYAVRQFACDALEGDPQPDLLALVEPTVRWGSCRRGRRRERRAPALHS
ncbi:MAG TPA: hypothetical protein VIX82_19670 [Solirubrobacteraceae bacterium]